MCWTERGGFRSLQVVSTVTSSGDVSGFITELRGFRLQGFRVASAFRRKNPCARQSSG